MGSIGIDESNVHQTCMEVLQKGTKTGSNITPNGPGGDPLGLRLGSFGCRFEPILNLLEKIG